MARRKRRAKNTKAGYVYVLSNPFMPGLVKIGRTTSDPEKRAKQLCTTGVPAAFECVCICGTWDCAYAEEYLHEFLNSYRISNNREFFRIEPETAKFLVEREVELLNLVYEIDTKEKALNDHFKKMGLDDFEEVTGWEALEFELWDKLREEWCYEFTTISKLESLAVSAEDPNDLVLDY